MLLVFISLTVLQQWLVAVFESCIYYDPRVNTCIGHAQGLDLLHRFTEEQLRKAFSPKLLNVILQNLAKMILGLTANKVE